MSLFWREQYINNNVCDITFLYFLNQSIPILVKFSVKCKYFKQHNAYKLYQNLTKQAIYEGDDNTR